MRQLLNIVAPCCSTCQLPLAIIQRRFGDDHPLRSVNLNPHDTEKLHIHDSGLVGINRSAANDRISAAVADHEGEVDAGNMAIQIPAAIGTTYVTVSTS